MKYEFEKKAYSMLLVIPIMFLIVCILLNVIKPGRPFYSISGYHFNLIEGSKITKTTPTPTQKKQIDIFRESFIRH